jgi:hypothetical protein
MKICDRIAKAIKDHGDCGFIQYYDLARHVFPKADYPRAWGYPTRGGPPGCYMSLSRAIREHGFYISYQDAPNVVYATVGLGKNKTKLKEPKG